MVILGLLLTHYLNRQWRPILTNIIQNAIIDASDSLYRAEISNIKVNVFLGNVSFDEIHIYPDTTIYNLFITKRIAPENTFKLKINKLTLKNINPFKIYFDREIDMDDIIIREPELIVEYNKLRFQKKSIEDTTTATKTMYQRINYLLNSIRIDYILLSDVNFQYIDKSISKTDPTITAVKKLTIRLKDILIDSVAQYDTERFFTAKEISADLREYEYLTEDSLYKMRFERLQLSTLSKDVVVSKIGLIPRYGEMAFSNLFDAQKERYRLTLDSIKIEGLNYQALVDERFVYANKIRLVKPTLGVFLNRNKARVQIDKGKNFPILLLQKANWSIHTDIIEIRNGNISYTEYNPETESKGTIQFQNLRGNITNVTNDSSAVIKNNFATANFRTVVQQKGDLRIDFRFDLTDKAGGFTVNANLAPTPISAFNPVTRPLAKVIVSSGDIKSMNFTGRGNVNSINSTVQLNYSDLNVILLKTDENNNLKRMGFVSVVANAMLIKRDNPEKNNALRVSNTTYKRVPNSSFFNMIWKGLFAGVKESLGVTQEQEAKMKEKAATLQTGKDKKEQRKQDRQERRNN